jgi:hypothetical protein
MSDEREIKVFCTRLDVALVREVKVYAATNGLHVQDVIEQALRAQLRRKPTKTRSTP